MPPFASGVFGLLVLIVGGEDGRPLALFPTAVLLQVTKGLGISACLVSVILVPAWVDAWLFRPVAPVVFLPGEWD